LSIACASLRRLFIHSHRPNGCRGDVSSTPDRKATWRQHPQADLSSTPPSSTSHPHHHNLLQYCAASLATTTASSPPSPMQPTFQTSQTCPVSPAPLRRCLKNRSQGRRRHTSRPSGGGTEETTASPSKAPEDGPAFPLQSIPRAEEGAEGVKSGLEGQAGREGH